MCHYKPIADCTKSEKQIRREAVRERVAKHRSSDTGKKSNLHSLVRNEVERLLMGCRPYKLKVDEVFTSSSDEEGMK